MVTYQKYLNHNLKDVSIFLSAFLEIHYNMTWFDDNIDFDHLYFDIYRDSLGNINFASAKMLETPSLKSKTIFH